MANWRTILGVILILAGGREIYLLTYGPTPVTTNFNPAYIKVAAILWIFAGAVLLARGFRKKAS